LRSAQRFAGIAQAVAMKGVPVFVEAFSRPRKCQKLWIEMFCARRSQQRATRIDEIAPRSPFNEPVKRP
jgi:hypothetical protein